MPKRILNGTVCSASNTKTVVVKVERMLKHPIYKTQGLRHLSKLYGPNKSRSVKNYTQSQTKYLF